MRKGFTAVDVLLTIGVIGVTAGVSVPMYRNYQIRSDLDLAVAQTIGGLSRAQLLSQTGQEDGMWGFRVPEGTIFQGDNYVVRDPAFDEIIALPTSISVYGVEEVVFSRVDGIPDPLGDIILEALNGERRTITVTADGTLSAGEIESPEFGDTGSDSGDTGSTTGGDTGSDSGGDTGTDGGDDGGSDSDDDDDSSSDDDDGSGGSSGGGGSGDDDDDGSTTCEDRFSVASDGTIETTGTVSATVKALGAEITYGAGGPEIAVRADISTDGGSTWNDLFSNAEIDGGEQQTISNITSGQKVVFRINGRYGWLFNKTYKSNDNSGHIEVLRNGDNPPDYAAYDDQDSLESFLQDILGDDGKISIGQHDVVLLGELGSLGTSSADFQDAVLQVTFNQDEGSCAKAADPRFKLTWDRLENTGQGNAQKKGFVGQSAWAYGEGQWIPLYGTDGQIATDGGITEDVAGMAIQRQNGKVRVLAHGSLPNGKEIVDVKVVFDGAEVTSISNDEGQNRTEGMSDNVVNDGAGGDEAYVSTDKKSAVYQTRVTSADDAIFVHWIAVDTSTDDGDSTDDSDDGDGDNDDGVANNDDDDDSSGDATNDEDDGDGDNDDGVANNDEDDDGDGDDDDGVANNGDGDTDPCAAGYTVNNGKIVLTEAADITFKALGSHITYGNGGPEVQVRMNVSTNGGSTWKSLFGFRDIDGGETETITDIPSGSTILLKAEGRRAWLFRQETQSGDGAGRIKVFRRKQSDPGSSIFTTPNKLKPFVRSRLQSRKFMIGAKEALALIELEELGTKADFQDAAILLTIEKPASEGICGARSDDDDDSSGSDDDDSSGSGGDSGSGGGGSGDDDDDTPTEITICHFPPGNPRNHQTLTIATSSWPAHAAHGDRKGACEGDEDGDGILNSADLCPGTFMPESVPTEHMLFKRFALTEDSHIFRKGPRKKVGSFTLSDTKGCSCGQLVDVAEKKKLYRFSQYPSLKRQMRSLFPFYTRGARQYGCGKAILNMVKRRAG